MIEERGSCAERWARPVMIAVAGLAALLYARNLASSDFVPYYSAAARSMSESWSAFLFGSFDPAGSITLDKIPGFLWPQALAARVLGFHAWALTLPQVVEGVVAVLALYAAVRRWAGAAAGVLAAAIFTFTPVAASMFGHAMEDGALTMCSVLAAAAWQRAVQTARLRALLLAGVWVGLGFQAKMLAAWAILPALALAYLVAAPAGLRRRLWHLALAGAVVVAVSASWMLIVALTPAADRPFVDGTTSNDVAGMVLGYNGATRFGALGLAGAITPDFGDLPAVATGGLKLLDPRLATQIGWLYPLAVVSLVVGVWERRGQPRTDPVRAGLLMWGLWLAATAAIYSAGTIIHTTYVAALAAPLAALSGFGIVRLWQAFRAGGARRWALPACAAVTLAWAAWLSSRYPGFLPWVTPGAVVLAATGSLVAARVRGRLAVAGMACAVAAMVVTPAAWAASALDPLYDGTVLDASAGPSGIFEVVAPDVWAASHGRLEGVPYAGAGIGLGPTTQQQRATLAYLEANRDGATYLVATQSVALATLYIRDSGQPVLLVGGFTGRAPFPTLARFQQLVASGQVRYALVPDPPQGSPPTATRDGIAAWVRANCQPVSPGTHPVAPMGDALYAC
ncbi:MAG TPA: glycosyltransferase family 39 protein [Terriglobales bacterium]|nr:glycosyltransferase family 39 protein [Terriglobales bacterium]